MGAKSITTWSWFKVLTNEEGLKCLVKAKDDPKGLLACKSKVTEEQTNNVTPSEEDLETVEKLLGVAFGFLFEDWEISVNKDLVKCWEKFKRDDNQMPACMARTITTWSWFKVLTNEEGLKCLLKAKGDPEGSLACKSKAANDKAMAANAGAASVSSNLFLGASLAALLLARAG